MKFSEVYRITRDAADDWFDPVLTVDTRVNRRAILTRFWG